MSTAGPAHATLTVLLFANPIAGRGTGARLAERLLHRLESDGFHVITLLQRPDLLDERDVPSGAAAAVVIGGDGTLRAAAECLLRLAPPLPPLLPVPLGPANLMGRHLGIHWNERDVEQSVSRAVTRGHVRLLDAGRANGRLFLLMAGVGFDAHVVHELDRLRTGPIRPLSYVRPAAAALLGYRYSPIRVVLDGKEVFPLAPGLAFVGNLPEYGTGFPVLPLARADDGLLDVCVLPCQSRAQLLRWFVLAAARAHAFAETAVYVKGTHVLIESAEPLPVQVDGDPTGHTPVRLDLLPVRIPFLIP